MLRNQRRESGIMKNQVNMTLPKETNKTLITDPKDREIYKLSQNKFRIILFRKFSEVQENTDNKTKLGK